MSYLEPTHEQGRRFFGAAGDGPVEMLNLLRFRDVADYSATPDLAPAEPISGAEAYRRYMVHTEPFLREAGGELVYIADGTECLIGPPDERWDLVMVVRHASAKRFLAFASDKRYLAGLGHRQAAIADSRLVPMRPRTI